MSNDGPMVRVSREMAVELGMVEPTAEELSAPVEPWSPPSALRRADYAVREWLSSIHSRVKART